MTMVAGTWDNNGGKESGYMQKLSEHIDKHFSFSMKHYNGGNWDDIHNAVDEAVTDDLIMWFPDIPNDKPKLVRELKKRNPTAILVTSKNNIAGKYDFFQLTAHALRNKANLFIEFTKNKEGLVEASVFDPLGNSYCYKVTDIDKVAKALVDRIRFLWEMTRVGSKQVGDKITFTPSYEDDLYFVNAIKNYAKVFHKLIHGANTSRFLGNCSFRCTMGGFPSFRKNGYIFVSKRNIDKREIGAEGFVAVNPITLYDYINNDIHVEYYGEDKPSVDTPVQLALYAIYPNIKWIIHSHAYIDGAPFTERSVPCGATQEIKEILAIEKSTSAKRWRINLKGHGSLVGADKIEHVKNIPYLAREFPEHV